MILIIIAGLAGVVLGIIFFGGLWWTVKVGVLSRQPVLVFISSLLIRTIIVLAGFFYVTDGQWDRLLVCLLGFVFTRFVVMRYANLPAGNLRYPAREAGHAPEP